MASVLVVDDEFGIAELFEAVLSDEGHRVFTAANGRHALEVLERQRPDIIFLDYMMPVMDGARLLSQLRAHPDWQNIPVIMMSSIPEEAVAARSNGYVHFLRKPFSVFSVLDLVSRYSSRGSRR